MVSSIWLSILCLSECQFLSFVSVGLLWSPWSTFFFSCPLAQSLLSWLQSLLFPFSPMCPCVLVFSVSTWMSCMLHLVSLCTFSICLSFSCGIPGMISGFMVSVLALWRSSCRLRCTQGSTSHNFSSALNPFAANATSIGNGELAVLLPLLSMVVCL